MLFDWTCISILLPTSVSRYYEFVRLTKIASFLKFWTYVRNRNFTIDSKLATFLPSRVLPDSVVAVTLQCRGLTSHSTHHRSFRDDFYRTDGRTDSVKALKKISWSSRSGLNPTRTIPPCYSNTTLGNRLYVHSTMVSVRQTQYVGTVRTDHISVLLTVNIVSHNPAQSSSDNIPS